MGKIQSPEAVAKNSSTSLYGNITEISESPFVEGLIYIGTDDGLIQVTEDDGKNWTKYDKFPDVPKNTYVSCLMASKHDKNTVYATFDGRKQNNLKPMILKSTNRGKTWENITANLPERGTAFKIEQDYKNENLLFVGTEFGFYFSISNGEKWLKFSNGLPTIQVRDIAIQQDEDDIVIATFGRGFYILDDYSPLRNIDDDILESTGTLFPVADAFMFIKSIAKYGQGATKYSAKNPPVAATFTYYLKEVPKTLKQIRKAQEKELTKQGKDIEYPTFEELQKEDEEEKAYLLFTITDLEGNIVRRLKKQPKSGINRITWDMKFPSLRPIISHKSKPDYTGKSGFPVPPGEYKVKLTLYSRENITEIGDEQTFNVLQLQNNTLPRDEQEKTKVFYSKVSNLIRAVYGASLAISRFELTLKQMRISLYATTQENKGLFERINNLIQQLYEISIIFHGNSSISNRNANQPPSIIERLGTLTYSFHRSTTNITSTMTEQYDIVANEFEEQLTQLKQIEKEILILETELEKIEAPIVPGRLPDWEK